MKKEKQLLISENASIKQAILKMKKNGTRTVVVADAKKFLQGTLSEGDIQKALIKNISLSSSIRSL